MTKFSSNLNLTKSKDKTKKFRNLSKAVLYLMTITLTISALAVYLVEVNYITTRGFYLKEIEEKIDSAKEEKEKLSLQVVQMKSMSNLSAKIAELNMVPAEKIIYYNSAGQTVAQK
ncbi:hypothetical protein HZB94_04835 [Candidatus Falkowbacteria bacterium]|nr:hypothetical protein [Candidatus Falkowbacteria bacterium]